MAKTFQREEYYVEVITEKKNGEYIHEISKKGEINSRFENEEVKKMIEDNIKKIEENPERTFAKKRITVEAFVG